MALGVLLSVPWQLLDLHLRVQELWDLEARVRNLRF